MGLASTGYVVVRDGDAGFPAIVVANPADGRCIYGVACLKSIVHNNLSESHRAED